MKFLAQTRDAARFSRVSCERTGLITPGGKLVPTVTYSAVTDASVPCALRPEPCACALCLYPVFMPCALRPVPRALSSVSCACALCLCPVHCTLCTSAASEENDTCGFENVEVPHYVVFATHLLPSPCSDQISPSTPHSRTPSAYFFP